jgi:hypothetical protein
MPKGSLTVVGTGYQLVTQLTPEALTWIRKADRFFFLADVIAERWLQQLHPRGESLGDAYAVGKDRSQSYEEMVERMLAPIREGLHVCGAFYGHPGVCAYAPHEAVRRARQEGYAARMLPGISSIDCLFADLGLDPSAGCQIFEATDFLIRKRRLDNSVSLLLWQICCIGVSAYYEEDDLWNPEGVRVLAQALQKMYSPRHRIIVYEASTFPVCDPSIQHIRANTLHRARISSASMLYVPPMREAPDNWRMIGKLKLT